MMTTIAVYLTQSAVRKVKYSFHLLNHTLLHEGPWGVWCVYSSTQF